MEVRTLVILSACLLDAFDVLVRCDLHSFDDAGHRHTLNEDHEMFLGKKLKSEFDSLTLDESKRRLR